MGQTTENPEQTPRTPRERADRVNAFLQARGAPPAPEGDELRKLSSNSTLAVIIIADDLFAASGMTGKPAWEHFVVICGVCACFVDAIVQYTGLPKEAVPYMVGDAVNFLFAGPERKNWSDTEKVHGLAVKEYKHLIGSDDMKPYIDGLGAAFYTYIDSHAQDDFAGLLGNFKVLMDNPDIPEDLKRAEA